jgi:hypothetical protein
MLPRRCEGVVKLLLGLDKNCTDRRQLEGDKPGTKLLLLLLLLLPPSVSCSCGGGETVSIGKKKQGKMKPMKTKQKEQLTVDAMTACRCCRACCCWERSFLARERRCCSFQNSLFLPCSSFRCCFSRLSSSSCSLMEMYRC